MSNGSKNLLKLLINDGWGTLKPFEKQNKLDVKLTEFYWIRIFQNAFLHDSWSDDLLVFVLTFESSFQLNLDFQVETAILSHFLEIRPPQPLRNPLSWIARLEIFQHTLHDEQEI